MRKLLLLVIASRLLGSCSPNEKKPAHSTTGKVAASNKGWHFHKLPKLLVTGDFDGDQRLDTVYQHTLSGLTKTELDSCPDPMHHDWDDVVKWLARQQAQVVLTLNKPSKDILRVGAAQGLYCLLNIGDNNADGKDELAFVVDYADFSRLTQCRIVTRCQGRWKLLKEIAVNEDVFDTSTDSIASAQTTGFLLKRGWKWFYTDYLQDTTAREDDSEQLHELLLDKCN